MLTSLLIATILAHSCRTLTPQDPALASRTPSKPSIYPTFGSPVSGIGDVDGDGVPEVLVADTNTNDAHVWLVSLRKRRVIYEVVGLPADASLTTEIRDLGDVDGDGHPDWVVGGTWTYPPPEVLSRQNRPSLPLDKASGSLLRRAPTHADLDHTSGALVYSGSTGQVLFRFTDEIPNQELGRRVSGAGDLDHDGHADILVGARRVQRGDRQGGIAYVRSGRDGSTILVVGTGEPLSWSAGAVEGVGDVDGDGIPDVGVVCGAPSQGRNSLVVYSGRTGAVLHRIENLFEWGMNHLRACGDLDGDGKADLLVASHQFVRVLSGSAFGILRELGPRDVDPKMGPRAHDSFATAIAFLRDRSTIHGESTIVSVAGSTNLWGGTVYFCSAADGGLRSRLTDTEVNQTRFEPPLPGADAAAADVEVHHLGCCLANLGDVDGDGYDDLACGSENWDGGEDGQVFVVDGLKGTLLYELRREGDDIRVFTARRD
jgi:hypothetical protein